VEAVLSNLDFREKGGYTRAIVEVEPTAADGRRVGEDGGGTVRALLYTATPENPGFREEALTDAEGAATRIAESHGPSGTNLEYLLELSAFLRGVGEEDEHVETLVRLVGVQRARRACVAE
jgi:cation transport regulator ChaC|tara:strand:- start:900 stop:1262 length:363 start_codon:yes stop_codon:yes gene_type:complete